MTDSYGVAVAFFDQIPATAERAIVDGVTTCCSRLRGGIKRGRVCTIGCDARSNSYLPSCAVCVCVCVCAHHLEGKGKEKEIERES